MSVRIPSVDLSTAIVGSSNILDWSGYGLPTGDTHAKLPQLQMFNDSGCALDIRLNSSGRTFYLPPGGWHTDGIDLKANDTSLTWTVVGVIPNSPITTLTAIYWAPGEAVTGVALGNSPIGISGSVTTSSIQTLKNDGQAPATSIIESTPSDQVSSSFSLNNDGSGFWQILSAGVLRGLITAVRGNAGGGKATITIGDAGDTSILTVHGTADNATNATTASAVAASGVTSGNLASGVKQQDGSTVAGLASAGGGSAGTRVWVGTTDPGGSAAEGDVWIKA